MVGVQGGWTSQGHLLSVAIFNVAASESAKSAPPAAPKRLNNPLRRLETAKILRPPARLRRAPSPASNESPPGREGAPPADGPDRTGMPFYDRRTLQNPAAVFVLSPIGIQHFRAIV